MARGIPHIGLAAALIAGCIGGSDRAPQPSGGGSGGGVADPFDTGGFAGPGLDAGRDSGPVAPGEGEGEGAVEGEGEGAVEPDAGGDEPDAHKPLPDASAPPEAEDEPAAPVPNAGWIGSPCRSDDDCQYEEAPGGFCLDGDEGWPGGTCSLPCDRLCPDREGDNYTVTFCVTGDDGQGHCVSRCGYDLFESGCREAYACAEWERHEEPESRRLACMPADQVGPGDEPGPCLTTARERGLNVQPAESRGDHPVGRPELSCEVEEPVRLSSPVLGVDYRYYYYDEPSPMYMACELSMALSELGEVLAELDVVELIHVGTYNCRTLREGGQLSTHGLGLAIDIGGVRLSDGTVYLLEDHWESLYDEPVTPGGRVLYDLAWAMHLRGIFNIVLTPDYNAAHATHFHVDLTPGANFLGKPGADGADGPGVIGTFGQHGHVD